MPLQDDVPQAPLTLPASPSQLTPSLTEPPMSSNQPAVPTQPSEPQSMELIPPHSSSDKTGKGLVIGVALFLVIVLAAGIWYVLTIKSGQTDQKVGPQPISSSQYTPVAAVSPSSGQAVAQKPATQNLANVSDGQLAYANSVYHYTINYPSTLKVIEASSLVACASNCVPATDQSVYVVFGSSSGEGSPLLSINTVNVQMTQAAVTAEFNGIGSSTTASDIQTMTKDTQVTQLKVGGHDAYKVESKSVNISVAYYVTVTGDTVLKFEGVLASKFPGIDNLSATFDQIISSVKFTD